ncbi:formyltetrahydrofolate deformylase [Croceicoccus bisphenolivorans]|uniref:formyltetrahydrofolate deformylase n=1 Tax=Croceicoccus bisphenolivorans TaxID=1783232 RepID=UPI00082C0801|nr:formyltetrahydrofolate deformylase [Croceicoccus bisphenolivorans]
MTNRFVLTLSCADRPGLVAAVAGCLAAGGGNIVEAQQFDEAATGLFFMRIVFDVDTAAMQALTSAFSQLADNHTMTWEIAPLDERKNVLLLVSKFDHCLGDLLYRQRTGELAMNVVGVVSNHARDHLKTSLLGDLPYHHLPVTRETKPQQEAQIKAIIEESGADLIVLARYMQILSDDLAGYLAGRCINIHHSFLPGFKGAKPYHQAHERGVKMIGATAHYVTADLDEGPIIAQDVEQISHADSPDDLVRKGRDIERRVLARAVRLHLEDRVLLSGARTIVFQS